MVILYQNSYKDQYVSVIKELWPDILDSEIDAIMKEHEAGKNPIFLMIDEKNHLIGFCNTAIRTDYVEGSMSSPTAYIEGIYVTKEYRRNKVAKQLLQEVIAYYKAKGIQELGSDTPISNSVSQDWHRALGFREVSTIKHYIMKIDGD